ncbi:NAD(P)-dependent methylenetetrahydromethanopterin dehydrogenase [Trinickia caryophylli]|uniref:Methylene-tetrahydromethanopterin dehydrogenase n=1 Tax=Trinickia caryophylli TaxID=28094 RepID=A0A1X7E3S7_TRICW|nr:NAD(P)-dependent methylenetetrahydromethanopterin dehydrogenase [Trinickia caryophylli]PMS14016.1 methylenetetrahydromethanopterin dehydrogenase [Trinickia caryophylli]TRX17709.1 methylenetetrahydromethanopterin dehydrogenase [Trinickia caryophylli]WQE11531.1 NAD(P)-dependent methylenetetrahydromethanopterin dehydrogenase [Trinickia caryophylli]SMF26259.1 methylene-tetrahydromethanopterin dehydrogenase [Trinickia caryophylli]GLU32697.1 methylenetetrahydromethanopterin dehydrogenase [Trinick
MSEATATERPYILHMLTATPQMSPFDVNMAADAGYQVIVPYCNVEADMVTNLTQDAIFSRGPKGVSRTGIFIGGRDVMLAADMLETARKAMVPPFEVSVFADPSGSYTTAAALVALVERHLKRTHEMELGGKRVLILGGTGAVGRIAAAMAASLGADVTIASHGSLERARHVSEEINTRFGIHTTATSTASSDTLRAALADTEILMATATAGIQVASADDLAHARRLIIAADVNAVPPEGIAGVNVMNDGKPIGPNGDASPIGIGALAIGNVKYQVEHRLFVQMRTSSKPVYLGFPQAFAEARAVAAGLG